MTCCRLVLLAVHSYIV